MRPLEAGAGGVMAAQVRSAAQAEEVMQWAKFHPRGLRGVNGTGVDGRYATMPMPEYMKRANDETFVAIQIEHIDAVDEVEKIAAFKDVDMLFIGPADLGQSMGIVGDWDNPQNLASDRARRQGRQAERHPLGDPAAQRRLRQALRRSRLPDVVGWAGRVGGAARAEGVFGGV